MANGNGSSELTEKQAKALDAIKDGANAKGVAAALGITQAGAHSHINALTKKGFLEKDGRLTSKAVEVGSTRRAPKRDEVPEIDLSGGGGNGAVDAFERDIEVTIALKAQRESIATTIGGIEGAIAEHERRIQGIGTQVDVLKVEQEQHLAAIQTLENNRQAVENALDALPTPA